MSDSTPRPGLTWPCLLAGLLVAHCGPGGPGRDTVPHTLHSAARITSSGALDQNPAFSPDGRSLAFSSSRSGSFQIYVLSLDPGGRPEPVTSDAGQNVQPAWSPDGRSLAYHSVQRGGLWVVDASGGVARQITTFGSQPAWSPDGRLLAFASSSLGDVGATSTGVGPSSSIWTVQFENGERRRLPAPPAGPVSRGHPTWAPDGRFLAFVEWSEARSRILAIAPAGGATWTLHDDAGRVFDPGIAHDGRSLIFASETALWCLPLDSIGQGAGPAERLVSPEGLAIRHLSRSPDGRRAAYSVIAAESALWSLDMHASGEHAGAPTALTGDPGRNVSAPAFSPDGDWVAYAASRSTGTGGEIRLVSADGRDDRLVATDGRALTFPSWLPGGRALAFVVADQDRRGLESSALGTALAAIVRPDLASDVGGDVVGPVRVSPDGRRIALAVRRDGATNIWTLPYEGGSAAPLTADDEFAAWPSWSPDGRWVAYEVRRGDDSQIEVVSAEGGRPLRLTGEPGLARPSAWSPDGQRIAFAERRDGVWNIAWVTRDGRERRQITSYGAPGQAARQPAWSPRGDRVVFVREQVRGDVWVGELR
jgi:Tol biopolymer transport system component